jgi:uncharacterized protein (TIRG00374 family)
MPTTPSSRLRWHTVFVGVLTLVLIWWFFRTIDLREVGRALAAARPLELTLALVVTLQTYLIRAWRWQVLLAPIGRAKYRNAFRTTVIGFTTTFLLPGRIGEILRPYLLARAEGFSPAATFATIILERILDLVAVLLLFAVFLATTRVDVGPDLKLAGLVTGGLALVALVAMALLAKHPDRLGRWTTPLLRLLPKRLSSKAAELIQRFAEGLAVMHRPGPLIVSAGLSLLLWLSLSLGVWLTSIAFAMALPFTGSFLVLMFLVVGVAVPTPAGVGAFHWAYRVAVTTFFAANEAQASAAAIVLHALSFIPISLLGLVFMAQDGFTLSGLRRMTPTAEAAEHPVATRPKTVTRLEEMP